MSFFWQWWVIWWCLARRLVIVTFVVSEDDMGEFHQLLSPHLDERWQLAQGAFSQTLRPGLVCGRGEPGSVAPTCPFSRAWRRILSNTDRLIQFLWQKLLTAPHSRLSGKFAMAQRTSADTVFESMPKAHNPPERPRCPETSDAHPTCTLNCEEPLWPRRRFARPLPES